MKINGETKGIDYGHDTDEGDDEDDYWAVRSGPDGRRLIAGEFSNLKKDNPNKKN
jgi:hypothetical protein